MTTATLLQLTRNHERPVQGASLVPQPNGVPLTTREYHQRGFQRPDQQAVLLIRGRVHQSDSGRFIRDSLAELHAFMHQHRIRPTGPPFARCRPTGVGTVDIETGWPLEQPAEGRGRIHGASLPTTLIRHTTPHSPRNHEPANTTR